MRISDGSSDVCSSELEPRSAVNILDLPGGLGCEAGGDLMGPYDHQIWSSSGSKYACAWDYGRARVIQQPVESTQVIGRATFQMADEQDRKSTRLNSSH